MFCSSKKIIRKKPYNQGVVIRGHHTIRKAVFLEDAQKAQSLPTMKSAVPALEPDAKHKFVSLPEDKS